MDRFITSIRVTYGDPDGWPDQPVMPVSVDIIGNDINNVDNNWVWLSCLGLGPSAVAWMTDYVYQDTQPVGMSLLWT